MGAGPLIDRVVCLSSVSKDLEGELALIESQRERCRERECTTLETLHHLKLAVTRHDCDSNAAGVLDGTLSSGDLVHKFEDGDGMRRGVHEATFRWNGAGALAVGTLRGVTNAGTHRAPAFEECQRCDSPGVIEGLLVGTIRRARDPRLRGCAVQAAYRLRFDASSEGGSGAVRGTLEGAIVCDCPDRPQPTCVEFSAMPLGRKMNPRDELGVSFEVFDDAGVSLMETEVRTRGAVTVFTGLDVGYTTEVKLPGPCSAVEATLMTTAAAARLDAYNTDGSLAGSAVMSGTQNVAETLTVTGPSIERAVITAPSDETLLLRFCFTPR